MTTPAALRAGSALLAMALLCAGIWALFAQQNPGSEAPPKGSFRDSLGPAPSLVFSAQENIRRKQFTLRSLEGRPILVHFWATWCGPCVTELPELLQITPELLHQGISVVAISEDSDWRAVESFLLQRPQLDKWKDSAIFLLDQNNAAARAFETNRFPETFLLDRRFQIAQKFSGPQSWLHPEMRGFFSEWLKFTR